MLVYTRLMDMFRNLGIALTLTRERRGFRTRGALARAARIEKDELSKYEDGIELPRLEALEKILGALGMSPAEFFTEEARITANRRERWGL